MATVEMPFAVSRSVDATLISQVEDGIRVAIERGVFKPGTSLPTTREIAKSLGVGRVVVERALSRLKSTLKNNLNTCDASIA